MSKSKPIPLVARLAIQLKMLTSAEVEQALAESRASGNPKLAQVFLQMGLLDREQIVKLQQVQKDLVEKHRAKQEASGATAAPPRSPDAAREREPRAAAPTRPTAEASAEARAIHEVAGHAARTAAPMSARDVDALRERPSAGPVPARASRAPEAEPAQESSGGTPEVAGADAVDRLFDEERSPSRTDSAPVSGTGPEPAAVPSPPAAEPAVGAPAAFAAPSGSLSLELAVPEAGDPDRRRLEQILGRGIADGASDIHLHAGGPLKQRVHGELVVTEETIDPAQVERLVAASLTPAQRAVLAHDGELDFCLELPGIGRFRANAYRQQRGLDVVFRSVPPTPPTLEELGLPAELKKYTDFHQGMVLITGPAGCGKSATLAALVNHINETRDEHILTVEDPIEIIHPSKRCLVNQRHAGHHTKSFSRALRGALREDPDIIVIGELRDLETISLAMTAAETGHFVLATLHTANAVRTVNRMIGAFPSNEQDQVRAMLSESLRAVVSQRLVPTADGNGRVPALELLVINRAIGNLIRDEKTVQIRSSMQTGKAHGMYLLEQSLNELVAAGRITREVALEYAEEKKLITAGA